MCFPDRMVLLDVKRSEKKNEFMYETTVKAARLLGMFWNATLCTLKKP